MNLRFPLTVWVFLLLAGCASNTDEFVIIDTDPSGAFVQFQWNERTCNTPCTVKLDRRLRATITKEGYKTEEFYIEPGSKDIFLKLELIAKRDNVESTQLPDL